MDGRTPIRPRPREDQVMRFALPMGSSWASADRSPPLLGLSGFRPSGGKCGGKRDRDDGGFPDQIKCSLNPEGS